MITFQTHSQYVGDVAKAPFKSVTLEFHLPVYEYSAVGGDSTSTADRIEGGVRSMRAAPIELNASLNQQQDVARRRTTATESSSVEHLLTDTTYRIEVADSAIAGGDDVERARAVMYYSRALLEGNVDKLLSAVTVQYLMSDGLELGSQTFDFICLLTLPVDDNADATPSTSSRVGYLAVNRTAYAAFRQVLQATSLKRDDSLILQALSFATETGTDAPTLREDIAADFGRWLDRKTRGADGPAILDIIRQSFASLFDFPLAIPEIKSVKIAGSITLTPAAGDAILPRDFQDLAVSAECNFDNAPSRSLTFSFADTSKIGGATASFSLTAATNLYANGLLSPVMVRVRGFGTDLWSKEFAPGDSKLANLEITIQKPARLVLTLPPRTARESAAKKLRGRVLTLNKDCPLTDVLVLAQAKTSAEAAWRTVGAATTDTSGNFAIPYPYGTYTQARAMVSLSPKETADIPCSDRENESIADDFLYLLLTNPDCTPAANDEDCDCDTDKPNRLPDHSDLIGSSAYSQDIGGSCVNLSKPNRTISEFCYQAIVRASDPDVANYTLTRIETGIDAVDVSVMVGLKNEASVLRTFATGLLARAQQGSSGTPTPLGVVLIPILEGAIPHVIAAATALTNPGSQVTAAALASSLQHVDAVIAIFQSLLARVTAENLGMLPTDAELALASAIRLRPLIALAIDSLGSAARYELKGGASLRRRQPVSLNNPVAWQDDPETVVDSATPVFTVRMKADIGERLQQKFGEPVTSQAPPPNATFSQAVTVATGHILHYKAVFKSDGYSLGDLIYSLPLAPGQKKEIVVFDASHTLIGAEAQTQAQNERLALGLINDRDIATQIGGRISESVRGSSTANTSGISAGFGTGGQGYGSSGAYGGSGSAVIGVAGGTANANSTASQDSSRDVAQFFGEKLRQSIMQNAEGYRQMNASVVTSVQENQRYGVTSEVVANHNHCHALTMMYFEVLRHYAIFHELSTVEECVFVPLLLTKFSTENVARWRDVLAPALLPMPSETYLKPSDSPNAARPHPLLKAFDADQRIRTNYANIDMPVGSYDEERIQFIRGSMRVRVSIPRPQTRFDRIMSLPVTTKTLTSREIDPEATQEAMLKFPRKMAEYATKTAACAGLNVLFGNDLPPDPPGLQYKTVEKEILVKEAIFDAFMKLDANFESVPPAQCIRIVNFLPPPKIPISVFGNLTLTATTSADFFAENVEDRQQWQAYATLLGYKDVLTFLNAHFRGNLISEWDTIFNNEIVPLALERILSAVYLQHFSVDFAADTKYRGGERFLRINIAGTTSKKRNELPNVIRLDLAANQVVKSLKDFITLVVQDINITYSTSHYNGTLCSGSVNDDLLDGTDLFIPENSEEKRNPRREDRYLASKLIEHLNSNLEYYNKVLWYNLDPDRRYMLLDGFTIQIYKDDGTPIATSDGLRSLASVVKNEVIAVAGNSLVLPVAPGYRVNGSFVQEKTGGEKVPVTLFDHYKPLTPPEPFRISVPSKGVFAEAVQGVCNACEKIETERLQDWSRFPNTDEPTQILPVTTPTPTVTDWKAAFKDFATPIVNIQNAPALPAPGEGMQNLADLLGKSGVFKDITGLDANQQNVIRTYLSNQENAKAFGEMAKEMAMQQHNTQNTGKIMDSIKSAKDEGAINQEDYGKLVKDHLQQQIDGGKTRPPAITAGNSPLAGVTAEALRSGAPVDATQTFPDGTIASVSRKPDSSTSPGNIDFTVPGTVTPLKQPPGDACWAAVVAMLQAWKSGTKNATVQGEIAKLSGPYSQLLADNQKLVTAEKDRLLSKLEMLIDPIGLSSAMPDAYLKLMQQYGPLWATVDADLTEKTSEHAKFIYGMRGDGTPDGTMMRIIDPRTGVPIEQTFQAFMTEFEQLARTSTEVAINGQIARFKNPIQISGEGAGSKDVFDILTEIVRDASMGLTANPAAKLMPVPTGTDPYSFDHKWSGGWTGKTVVSGNGIESTALEFPIEHEMGGRTMTMPFRVLDSMSWDNARVSFGTDPCVLPLTRRFLFAADSANAPLYMGSDASRNFPLEATVQSHVALLFGYVVDVNTGAVVPLDLTGAPAAGLDVWLGNGGSSEAATTNKRVVLALYDLSMNEPRADFQPKQHAPIGPGEVARFYPLLAVWCANDCDEAAADFSMTRPPNSAMTENMMPGAAIGGSFYTDSNEEIHTVLQDLNPVLRAQLETPSGIPIVDAGKLAATLLAWKVLPSPRWNSIFAHYKLGVDLPATSVVNRSKGRRTHPDARQEMESATDNYVAKPVTKVEGQGAFDNIHIAPNMAYQGAVASMAPICQHDCLHLHWRWSENFSDNYVWGWSGGAPYAKAGAPMIPENQDLKVSLTGTTFEYMPVAKRVSAMQWQVFMHHGMAYATKLTLVGAALPMLEMNSITNLYPMAPWEQFYYHNRYWETGGANRTADKPRLLEGPNQANFKPLEDM